ISGADIFSTSSSLISMPPMIRCTGIRNPHPSYADPRFPNAPNPSARGTGLSKVRHVPIFLRGALFAVTLEPAASRISPIEWGGGPAGPRWRELGKHGTLFPAL